jgi:hypothetical protein
VTPLRANQRVILSEVPIYELDFPPRAGDRLTTSAGIATVTHIEQAGKEQVIWADYGSGISQPHVSEGILSVSPSLSESSPPEQKLARSRRHTPKGKACGWIEERQGNKARKKASVSYYYKWDDAEGRGSRYIPAGKVEQVREMVYGQCCGVAEVLQFLNGGIANEHQ